MDGGMAVYPVMLKIYQTKDQQLTREDEVGKERRVLFKRTYPLKLTIEHNTRDYAVQSLPALILGEQCLHLHIDTDLVLAPYLPQAVSIPVCHGPHIIDPLHKT